MVAVADNLLGLGLYTAAEAAFYAQVPVQTMNRWIYGDGRGDSVLRPQLLGKDERFITFLDFVQALAIREIRLELAIPLPKIRRAIEVAGKKYNVPYPLAIDHTVFLYGKELMIRKPDDEQHEQFIQLTGREAHHQMIQQVVRVYMKDLTFGKD